jgi:hypothetical protein
MPKQIPMANVTAVTTNSALPGLTKGSSINDVTVINMMILKTALPNCGLIMSA